MIEDQTKKAGPTNESAERISDNARKVIIEGLVAAKTAKGERCSYWNLWEEAGRIHDLSLGLILSLFCQCL